MVQTGRISAPLSEPRPLGDIRRFSMRRYPITLHQQSPIILGKNPKRERKIQSRSPVFLFTCNSHLQPREPCGSRHHRPSKDTRTRPVRSRTSPSILNTKHTDKDRKLDEPPHGDHGVYKEPTRLSRTSSYLNSISLNLRPTDRQKLKTLSKTLQTSHRSHHCTQLKSQRKEHDEL